MNELYIRDDDEVYLSVCWSESNRKNANNEANKW